MAVQPCDLSVPCVIGEQIKGHERHSACTFSATRSRLPAQVSKVVVVENAAILVELVVHQISHTNVVVLDTADPKVIMTWDDKMVSSMTTVLEYTYNGSIPKKPSKTCHQSSQ
jgi:hypothetical protein